MSQVRSDYNVNVNIIATDKTSGPAKDAAKGLGKLENAFKAVAASAIAKQIIKYSVELAKLGAAAERQGKALDNLAAAAGTSGDAITKAIQGASDYTIDKMTAMQAANRALVMDVAQTPAEFERLTRVATALGRAMGQDAAKSIDDFVTAAGRQSKLIADNLGLVVNAEDAYLRYAEANNISVDAMDDAAKKQAFLTEMLRQGEVKMRDLGDQTLDTAGQIEQATALWANFRMTVGKGLADALADTGGQVGGLNKSLLEHGDILSASVTLALSLTAGIGNSTLALERWKDAVRGTEPAVVSMAEGHAYLRGEIDRGITGLTDNTDAWKQYGWVMDRETARQDEATWSAIELARAQEEATVATSRMAGPGDFAAQSIERMGEAARKTKDEMLEEASLSTASRYTSYQKDVEESAAEFATKREQIETAHTERLAELKQWGNITLIEEENRSYAESIARLEASQAEQEAAQKESLGRMVLQHFNAWVEMNLATDGFTKEEVEYITATRMQISEQYGLVTNAAISEMEAQEAEWKRTMAVMTGDAANFFDFFLQQFDAMPDEKVMRIRTELSERPADIGGGIPRQHGGPVRAGEAYLVGERGPELFVPGRQGQIVNNSQAFDSHDTYMFNTPHAPTAVLESQRRQRRQASGRIM